MPTRFQVRELPLLLLGTVATLGGLYIALVPPGLPYDEPSHWLNVLHIVHHGSLPHIGDADVTYEAQMGPLAYLLAAFVAWPFSALSDETAFYAVRALGLVEHLGLTWIMWVLIRQALPSLPRAASAGATVIGLSPMLLAVGTSVQNDTLALLLAFGCLVVATPLERLTVRRAGGSGALAGAALLTKVIVWPVLLVLLLWWAWKRRLVEAAAFVGSSAAVAGWWFVRNLLDYGDLTGRKAVEAAGYHFPPLSGVPAANLARSVITYLWLPTEYVRNVVHSPTVLDLLIGILTLVGLAGGVAVLRHRPLSGLTGASTAVAAVAVGSWLVISVAVQSVAFRFAYTALAFWGLSWAGVAAACPDRLRPLVPYALGVLCLILSGWFLHAVAVLPRTEVQLSF